MAYSWLVNETIYKKKTLKMTSEKKKDIDLLKNDGYT